jgi:flagellar assembly protein FliH
MPKLITKNDSANFQRWNLPIVEDVSGAVANAKEDKAPGLMTAEQIERIQAQAYKEAYDSGFKKGHQQGMQAGQSEIARQSQLLEASLQSLTQPFRQLDDDVEQELVSLALAVARQLVRRELKADPGQVVAVVHEALAALPIGSREVKVCLHPDDVITVGELIATTDAERNWSLLDDASLDRGDCQILTETSKIDATLERRLTAVVSQLFGGQREQDSSGEPSASEITNQPVSES